jgi:hypothetical protein
MSQHVVLNFNSGELSPLLDARSDTSKYSSGTREMANLIPRVYGCAVRRPGTEYIGTARKSADKCLLVPFEYSATAAYVCSFSGGYIQFYYNGGILCEAAETSFTGTVGSSGTTVTFSQAADAVKAGYDASNPKLGAYIVSGGFTVQVRSWTTSKICVVDIAPSPAWSTGTITSTQVPVQVVTPYLEADLFELQFKQINDVMFITHNEYPIATLSRVTATSFVYTVLLEGTTPLATFVGGPFREENEDTGSTITPPAVSSDQTTGQTFSASGEYATYYASLAFNDTRTTNSGWIDDDVTDTWVRCQFGASKIINRIKIWPCVNTATSTRNVRHCKIEASNNGSTWTKLSVERWYGRCQGYNSDEFEIDLISNYDDYAEVWLDNTTAYTYYRVFASDNWGDATYSQILEIEMMVAESGTFTASKSVFNALHVGSLWRLRHSVTTETSGTLAGAVYTSPTFIKGSFFFSTATGSTLDGTIEIQRSSDYGATWQTYQSWVVVSGDSIAQVAYEETQNNVMYRVAVTTYISGSTTATLSGGDGLKDGLIQITGYSSATQVTAVVIDELGAASATYRWSEGAWSDYRGWPRTMTLRDERAVYAGSTSSSQTLWLSKVGDYYDFTEGTNADDAFIVEMATEKRIDIQWVAPRSGVAIGTTGGVWRLSGSINSPVMTPTNYSITEQSSVECANIQAVPANDGLLFIDRPTRHIYELLWDDSRQGYALTPITLLCEHLTEGGITDLCFQKNPEPIIWYTTGQSPYLMSLSYQTSQDVIAGARHPLGGTGIVESVCRIPGSSEDETWMVVRRTINSVSVRYIERTKPWDFGVQEDGFFVDSGLTYSGAATATVTGLNYLEGKTVSICGDGVAYPDAVVSSGSVTLVGGTAAKIHVGLSYTYTCKPMKLDVNTSSRGAIKKISKLVLSFYESLGVQYGKNSSTLYDVDFPRTSIFEAIPMYTGDMTLHFDGGFTEEDDLIITGSLPLPCTLLAIVAMVDGYGN